MSIPEYSYRVIVDTGYVYNVLTAAEIEAMQKDNQLWMEIRHAAKSNAALQTALDHCIIIYNLIKQDPIQHHPV